VGTHGREPEFEGWVGASGLLVVHFSHPSPALVWLSLEWICGGLGGRRGAYHAEDACFSSMHYSRLLLGVFDF